jgi:dipeptidyl aminopeptidase/acylaminoacyl peptidase
MKVKRYQKENLTVENIPVIPETLVKKLESYQNARSAFFCDWLPADKGMLIRTRFAEATQIHRVEIPKGMRRQLTFFNEPVGGGLVCPDPRVPYFLFGKDSAGDEQNQIYKFNYDRDGCEMLTDGVSRNDSYVWSNSGDRYAFSSTMRNGRDFDVWLGNLEGQKSFTPVVQQAGSWEPVDWSPDDRCLIVLHYVSANESYYYLLNIADKNLVPFNPVDQKIAYGKARWSRDGEGIYVISDQLGNFKQLLYYDLAAMKFNVLSEKIPWDIEDFDLSSDGERLALISNEDGWGKLYLRRTETGALEKASLPLGQVAGLKFNPDGSRLALVINTSRTPNDVYVMETATGILTRWTESETAGLATDNFTEPELIHYPTFDSPSGRPRMIPAFYYRPLGTKLPYPVLIICHGGPESQFVPDFLPLTQYYCNELGIAVIFPNVRGSSGYGKEYVKLDDWEKREDAVKDIGALLDWIAGNPELEARRVAVSGGSYGGYMVLAVMAHYADRLCSGVDLCGISNFVTFLENTAEYRKDLRRAEYGDERIPGMREFLNRISPLSNASEIRKPLFIIQGKNDPRVPVTEAEQIVKAVRRNGIEVWFLLADDEGHGFQKKKNRDLYNQAYVLFLDKFLLSKK